MISVIIVDYKTAERCVKYINDFCRTSDYNNVSFVVVDFTMRSRDTTLLLREKLFHWIFLRHNLFSRIGIIQEF